MTTQANGINGPNTSQTTSAAPTGTSSTTDVMLGIGAAITPTKTGSVLVIITGNVKNGTTGGGSAATIKEGTGTAPTNGAAVTGSSVGLNNLFNSDNTTGFQSLNVPIALVGIITGLTLGTAIWVDLAFHSSSTGTTTMSNICITLIEL